MQIIWVILCGSLEVERGVAEPHLSVLCNFRKPPHLVPNIKIKINVYFQNSTFTVF
jgi:hypothetical protein